MLFILILLIRFSITTSQQRQGWQPWSMSRRFYHAAPIVQFQGYQPPPQPPLREEYQLPAQPPGFIPQQFETWRKSTPPSSIWQTTLQNEYVRTETETAIYGSESLPPANSNGIIQMFDDNSKEANLPDVNIQLTNKGFIVLFRL
uniref:Uncharacterized protein n=1 Tax=Acrobeloides nanus TaxID=290746 RepID=A0A914BYS3_9BILA